MAQEWFRCQERLNGVTGTICGKPFTRKDNLKRHIRTQHQAGQAHPAGLEALALQGLVELSQTRPVEPAHLHHVLPHSQQRLPTAKPEENARPCGTANRPDIPVDQSAPEQAAPAQSHHTCAVPRARKLGHEAVIERPAAHADEGEPDTRAKKRWFSGRCIYQSVMPQYETKRSRKWPSQQKALSWLSAEAKDTLDRRIEHIMKQWGQSATHKGTCLLMPADWESAQPEEIAAKLTAETCPTIRDAHVTYKYSDHTTLLSRAIAWFETETWPRNGIQLDCFIECGPFERKDGSHLCHNSLCVNPHHLTYESVQTNLDRIRCHDEAKALRRGDQGQRIPAHCKVHDPPCLLQHSVLSTYERLALQFWVLKQSSPSFPPIDTRRSRWHTFPTFETQLPLTFLRGNEHCAVTLSPQDIAPPPDSGRTCTGIKKPTFLCAFCPRVKSFSSIISYWGHLVRKHPGSNQQIVDEVCRTARTWDAYWRHFPAQTSTEPTRRKLQQTAEEGFGWDTMLSWNLR